MGVEGLTTTERRHLLLVGRGLTSDEIVRHYAERGETISSHTVNESIDRARYRLGGLSRKQAARKFLETLTPDPLGVIPQQFGGENHIDFETNGLAAAIGGVREERASFFFDAVTAIAANYPGTLRSILIVTSAVLFLALAVLMKPAWDSLGWFGRMTERLVQ